MANQNSIPDLSTTPASNLNVLGQSQQGTAPANTIDNIFQRYGAILATFYDSLGGVTTAGGTATALTASITEDWAALANGLILALKAPSAATGASTLVVTVPTVGALASKKIRRQGDSAIQANDWLANSTILLKYDSAYDSAAGAWVLLNANSTALLDTLWVKGADVASATTTALGAGNFFHITGTTTITDIDFTSALDGRIAWLEFDGILTLTHNGTTLTLPGGANITTAAGDRAVIVQDNGDNVHVIQYQPALARPPYQTPWVAYTPTFTGFGTVVSPTFFSRRNGSNLDIMGKVTTGTPTAVEARMTMGFNGTNNNVTSDATVVPTIRNVGTVAHPSVATSSYHALIESNVGYFTFSDQSAGALTKRNGDALIGTGLTFSMFASVPISGW